MTFGSPERFLLSALVLSSAALFGRDLWAKIKLIAAGAPERERTDRIGARLLTVVREVLFQSRVIGGRPVVGTMHAMVFLGFLVFAFETLDHFLEPFGVGFLEPLLGGALPAFRAVLLVTSVLVSVGILSLFYRRFFMKKSSPDPESYSSGVVAILIFLLMLTYVNGVLEPPVLERANWWVHSLIIVVFPHLILRSKHFHILMAPVDIFFRTHRLGDFLPLDLDLESLEESGEEISLGLESMADVPWKMRMDFLSCVECRRCTEQCPAATCGQELNPRGFILAGREMLTGEGSVIGGVISGEALGQCTSCGACENVCPVGIEHLQLLLGAKRAQALATGKGMVAADYLQTVERHGNPFAGGKSDRQSLIDELGISAYEPGKTEYALWMGCVWNYNEDARSSLEATVKVLDAAGVSYGVLETESCSGHHSRRQGEEMQFQTLAEENIERFEKNRVTKLVAPCPHCIHTFRREYPTLKSDFEVEAIHHSELLTSLIGEGRLKLDTSGDQNRVVTYHDPCYLGRYEKVYEAPREVIGRSGFKIVELGRHRERSFCCGGGNAGFMSRSEAERRVDQERKDEITASGATTLVTACPECKMMLDAAVEETKDLSELVAESLTPAEAASQGP
ncbi:MAG: (Fe-S)-binding protein [Thermoanaerobaculia bacterium]